MESFHGKSGHLNMKVNLEEILEDLYAGLRSKDILEKRELSMKDFELILKKIIRDGLFTVEQFKAWKAHRPIPGPTTTAKRPAPAEPPAEPPAQSPQPQPQPETIETYVISRPEESNSWALKLFSTQRERMPGSAFKVNLHGRKYSFFVAELLFRGNVDMQDDHLLAPSPGKKKSGEDKRAIAMEFIAKHGWGAYLENRAFAANFGPDADEGAAKARLVVLHCRNNTYLAALHTPAPRSKSLCIQFAE